MRRIVPFFLCVVSSLTGACGEGLEARHRAPPEGLGTACEGDGSALALVGSDAGERRLAAYLRSSAPRVPADFSPLVIRRERRGAVQRWIVQFRDEEGVPLCGPGFVVSAAGGELLGTGLFASILEDGGATRAGSWDDDAGVRDTIGLALATPPSGLHVRSLSRCWDAGPAGLRRAWDFTADSRGGAFRGVVAANDVLRLESLALPLEGRARVYQPNPLGALTNVRLKELDDNGRLRNQFLRTKVQKGVLPATEPSGAFLYERDDPRFAEVSVFANAVKMLRWFESVNHESEFGCNPIELVIDAVFDGDNRNNARYFPGEFTNDALPQIWVGAGDGSAAGYGNMLFDFDVVAHELGHHFVYQTLKATTGEAAEIHEGLADFFVFAMTGDACLAESVCNAQSACAVANRCLRTAENTLKWGDASLLGADAHVRSQVLSGMLWDLVTAKVFERESAATLVLHALAYLSERSGYRDLIEALIAADFELASGAHGCSIAKAAKARNLGGQIDDRECQKGGAQP